MFRVHFPRVSGKQNVSISLYVIPNTHIQRTTLWTLRTCLLGRASPKILLLPGIRLLFAKIYTNILFTLDLNTKKVLFFFPPLVINDTLYLLQTIRARYECKRVYIIRVHYQLITFKLKRILKNRPTLNYNK